MDYVLSFSRNATTRSLVRSLGLPVSLPPALRRVTTPRAQRLLNDARLVVGACNPGAATDVIGGCLAPLGARVVWTGAEADLRRFQDAAEAWAEPLTHWPLSVSDLGESKQTGHANSDEGASAGPETGLAKDLGRAYGLVFDATGLRTREDLDTLHTFFSTCLGRLSSGGRVVVLAHPPDAAAQISETPYEQAVLAALWQGMEGFVRSLGKELGRKGSTANLLWVSPNAESRLVGPLRYFLSGYSAFVTSQPLRIDASVKKPDFSWDGPLLGKVALVTGGSRGIGKATAEALMAEGAKIAIVDHPAAAAEAGVAARELSAKLLLQDLAAADAPRKLADWIAAEWGAVDIVVHNAGVTRDKTLARMKRDAWDLVLDVNLFAALNTTDQLLRRDLIRAEGRVVVLSSVGGIAGNVGQTNYALSKAGLIGFIRHLAPTLASRGITVNAVAPGFIETQMTARMPAMIREAARRLSSLNQGGEPQDVAQAVTFFALPENHGVTGNVLRVCGGALIGA